MIALRRSFAIPDFAIPEFRGGRGVALAVGNFDGVHLGHRKLLEQVLNDDSRAPACMTFEPHPRAVLRPDAPSNRICGPADKLRLLAQAGIAAVFLPRFNRAFAQTSADDFADLLFGEIGAKRVVVGENFQFGKGRQGGCELLAEAARACGAEFIPVPLAASADGIPFSSGRVRDALADGDFAQARRLLGREWTMRGRVIRGAGFGRRLGCPTANLRLSFVPPVRGIFAAEAVIAGENRPRPAAVSAGVNPSVSQDNNLKIEAHLPGFSGELYGKILTLRPLAKLRDEAKFGGMAELQKAMADDVARAVGVWKAQ